MLFYLQKFFTPIINNNIEKNVNKCYITKVGDLMKKEYLKLFSFLLGITFISSGIIFTLSKVYKENKQQKIEEEAIIADEIIDVYETFRAKTEELSRKRDSINIEVSEYTSYYTGMEENYEKIIEELKLYETLVKEVEDAASYLNANCIKETYSNHDANNKCNAYIINYERTVNSFVGDIEFFNSKIDEYNHWIIEENEDLEDDEKYKEIERFVPIYYKEYIDVNSDGTYLGRTSD